MELEGGFLVAYLLMVLGLAGTVLPLLPGAPLIWLGVFIWAYTDGYQRIGWPVLAVLGLLALVALGSNMAMTTLASRKSGANWKSIAGALVGGLAGGLVASVVPVLGTLSGALLGAILGMFALEYWQKHDWRLAFQSVKGYILGHLASSLVEILICLLMLAIFAWQAFS